MSEFDKAIKLLQKAEKAARNAQAKRDAAEFRFDKALAVLRPEGKPTPEWIAYCDANGLAYQYDFGDTIC